ncbi:MAG: hypothetical protein GY874_12975 [Desulfobacteraceae bacterium]|nr:hypothetical protein [Desulfobacteraceae bacterium]
MKTKVWLCLALIFFQVAVAAAIAETYPDWMDQGEDVEQKASSIFKTLVDYTLVCVACGGALSVAVGLFQWTGRFFSQDRQKGAERMKSGFIGIVGSGVLYAIIAVAVNLGKG